MVAFHKTRRNSSISSFSSAVTATWWSNKSANNTNNHVTFLPLQATTATNISKTKILSLELVNQPWFRRRRATRVVAPSLRL